MARGKEYVKAKPIYVGCLGGQVILGEAWQRQAGRIESESESLQCLGLRAQPLVSSDHGGATGARVMCTVTATAAEGNERTPGVWSAASPTAESQRCHRRRQWYSTSVHTAWPGTPQHATVRLQQRAWGCRSIPALPLSRRGSIDAGTAGRREAALHRTVE